MIELGTCVFLVGAVFGMRYKVLILLPLTMALAFATPIVALLGHVSVGSALQGFLIGAVALQIGYIFGSFARFTVAAARTTRPLARSVKAVR